MMKSRSKKNTDTPLHRHHTIVRPASNMIFVYTTFFGDVRRTYPFAGISENIRQRKYTGKDVF